MADRNLLSVCLLVLSLCVGCSSVTKYSIEFQQETNRHFDKKKIIDSAKNNPQEENSKNIFRITTRQSRVAEFNLNRDGRDKNRHHRLKDGEVINFNPGDLAPNFKLWTLNGKFIFPSDTFINIPIFIHVFDHTSGFLECLWNSDEAMMPLIQENNTSNYVVISKWAGMNDRYGAKWMLQRIEQLMTKSSMGSETRQQQLSRFHFSTLPLHQLGNWIPVLLWQWQCVDHNCGLDQVLIQSNGDQSPLVLKRLDARYDWLPSATGVFQNKTVSLVRAGNGCKVSKDVNNAVAMVTNGSCSYFQKIDNMARSGALGVLVVADKDTALDEMNCHGDECIRTQFSIPAAMVENTDIFTSNSKMNVTFQNTPSENFFAAIDPDGRLAEVGWFLYPSMMFINWQSKWFDYKQKLEINLQKAEKVVEIFQEQKMQGDGGVIVNVSLPDISVLRSYSVLDLDMSLSCPGTRDTTCAHWDHTINLYVCCDQKSPVCGMELGRWISPFRRRIGRWITDVSPLLPLLSGSTCTFTMKTAPWAMPWLPSLNLRLSGPRKKGSLYPDEAHVLYEPGATFDKNYNSHFIPYTFTVPKDVKKVEIFAVITGHGSDENGCGEFCVTSHHFVVNGKMNEITFSDAGTPLGCADQVETGTEPNEHGTWLYGRNGWCDGRNVFPWVIDVTDQINNSDTSNDIKYFGWYNGTDPNPKQNPGLIYIQSYLIFYRTY